MSHSSHSVSRKSLFEVSAEVRFFLRPTFFCRRQAELREQICDLSHREIARLGCVMVISAPLHLEGNEINWI